MLCLRRLWGVNSINYLVSKLSLGAWLVLVGTLETGHFFSIPQKMMNVSGRVYGMYVLWLDQLRIIFHTGFGVGFWFLGQI